MLSVVSKLPSKTYRREDITLLTVSPELSDFQILRQIFRHEDWKIERAQSCQDAFQAIEATKPAVVICDTKLPDGTWQRVLQKAMAMEQPPMIVVVAPAADNSLWAEVLNLGGYDVLLKPLEKTEVISVITMAWRQWREQTQRRFALSPTSIPALCS